MTYNTGRFIIASFIDSSELVWIKPINIKLKKTRMIYFFRFVISPDYSSTLFAQQDYPLRKMLTHQTGTKIHSQDLIFSC